MSVSATTTAGAENSGYADTPSGDDCALPRGAYVGIGVGVAAMLIALLIALLFFLWRSKKVNTGATHAELGSKGWSPVGLVPEMTQPTPVVEIGTREPNIAEAKGDEVVPREMAS